MKFTDLIWKSHCIPYAIHAMHRYENGVEVSIVAGPKGCGIHGNIDSNTYEVMVTIPDGFYMERDLDPVGYVTPEQIDKLFWVIENHYQELKKLSSFDKFLSPGSDLAVDCK